MKNIVKRALKSTVLLKTHCEAQKRDAILRGENEIVEGEEQGDFLNLIADLTGAEYNPYNDDEVVEDDGQDYLNALIGDEVDDRLDEDDIDDWEFKDYDDEIVVRDYDPAWDDE